jgi:uncharacterized caspase-like protein
MRKILLVLLVVALAAAVCPAQAAERRVALVIGNGGYQKLAGLKNPVHDAEDVSTAFARLGFDVAKVTDGTQAQMMEAVEGFARRLAGAKAGFFFYAGHGVQSSGVNYVVPVDAAIDSEYQLKFLGFRPVRTAE